MTTNEGDVDDGGLAEAAAAAAPTNQQSREDDSQQPNSNEDHGGRQEEKKGPPDISNLHSVKIDNLSFDLTQEEITDMFASYGEIGDVYVPRNHHTQRMRGFAFVRYVEKQSADAAIDAMHEKEIAGRIIRVGMAEETRYERAVSLQR